MAGFYIFTTDVVLSPPGFHVSAVQTRACGMKWRFVSVLVLLGATALLLRARNASEIIPARQPLQSFPRTFDGWSSTDLPLSKDVLEVLGPGDFLTRDYKR